MRLWGALTAALFCVASPAFAQTLVTISPAPIQRFVDNNGIACVGCKLFTYAAGTTTKQATYTTSAGSTQQTNPIILNSRGEPENTMAQSVGIWLSNANYKFVLAPANDTDPPTNPFWAIDNIAALPPSLITPTLATLQGLLTATYPNGIWRVDYAAGVGAPPLYYKPLTGTCTANSLVNDGGSCVNTTSGDGNSWQAVFPTTGGDIREWGCKGDNSTDNSTCLQAAVNWGVAGGALVSVPPGKFSISTAVDGHDVDQLTIRGAGCEAPAWGLANIAPAKGSTIFGNTGTGKPIIDFVGANNIAISDLCFSAVGKSAPSTIGLIFGNGTRSQTSGSGGPGGSQIVLERVGVQLTGTGSSIPIYYNGGGLSRLASIWTLGDYGLVVSSDNPLTVSPPYGTFGSPIGTDGIVCSGCNLLGYGPQFPFYLEKSNNFTASQLYIDTINGGAMYGGQPYAMYIKDVIGVYITVEEDYFPSLFEAVGDIDDLHISGTAFPNLTPIASNPVIGYINGNSFINSSINVVPVDVSTAAVGSAYYFTMNGVTPIVTAFWNDTFEYNTPSGASTTNVLYGNLVSGNIYRNIVFNGDNDVPTFTFNVNGGAAPAGALRYFVNGRLFNSPTQLVGPTVSAAWIATQDPNNDVLANITQETKVTAIVGTVTTAVGAATTVSVYKVASGAACSAGTILHSGSFDANGTAATDQTLTLVGAATTLLPGDRICLQTTGGGSWGGGSGVGNITVFLAPS